MAAHGRCRVAAEVVRHDEAAGSEFGLEPASDVKLEGSQVSHGSENPYTLAMVWRFSSDSGAASQCRCLVVKYERPRSRPRQTF